MLLRVYLWISPNLTSNLGRDTQTLQMFVRPWNPDISRTPMELVYSGNTHCQSQNCTTHSNFNQNLIKPPQIPPFTVPLTQSKGTPAAVDPALLGKITKLQSARSARFERFALQDAARELLPNTRVATCLRSRISKITGVQVFLNKTRLVAQYGNLARCGAQWTCAVCAAKISEHRKNDLKQGMDYHKAKGGALLLLTLTNSHDCHDKLESLLTGQKKALASLWGDRRTKAIFASIGRVGQINAKEVLHGNNGWHPHNHILLFIDAALSPDELAETREKLAVAWINCCKKAGLPLPNMENGVDLQDGSRAEAYITKYGREPRWDMQHEMVKGHIKKGRAGGRTPFDLLRSAAEGDKQAGFLFQEFAREFKGVPQLTWSRGLRRMLKVANEKTEAEIVAETDKDAEMMLELDVELWRAVVKDGQRANLLAAVEQDPTLHKATELIRQALQRQGHVVLPSRDG